MRKPHQDKWEDLHKARLSPGGPDDVRQLAHFEWLGHSVGRGERIGEIVEPVGDCGVLHNITLMEDIWSRWRNFHKDLIRISGRLGGGQRHLLEKGNNLSGGQG